MVDLRLPFVRRKILSQLARILLDPRRDLVGFAFERSPHEGDFVLAVYVQVKKRESELGPQDVAFPRGGLDDAGLALGLPGLRGVPLRTDVKAVGRVQAHVVVDGMAQNLSTYGELRDRTRPLYSGVSVGHEAARGSGSVGALLRDRRSGRTFVLSNNHVLALGTGSRHSVPVPLRSAVVGDGVLQPGLEPLSLATAANRVGSLAAFLPLRYVRDVAGDPATDLNATDAALCEVEQAQSNLDPQIPYMGPSGEPIVPAGLVQSLRVGEYVMKVGRTTGLTVGRVIQGDALVRLEYPEGFVVLERQILATHMSGAGDSGSLVVTVEQPRAAGLLIGGSDFVSIFTPLPRVLRLLGDATGMELELLR